MTSEPFLRAFHAAHPGITARAFARSGSYDRLAARVPVGARVLDLGCGDGTLLARLPRDAVGIDVSREELALARCPVVHARAQALPFAAGAFDVVVSHLAFMLMDAADEVVSELARVLVPGGAFFAVLGGGPTADGDDAFHQFLALARPRGPRLGDPRAGTEAGWRQLFAGWDVTFERWPLDLGGSFDDVWTFLSSGYQAYDDVRAQLAARWGTAHVPCTVVTWLATAVRRAGELTPGDRHRPA